MLHLGFQSGLYHAVIALRLLRNTSFISLLYFSFPKPVAPLPIKAVFRTIFLDAYIERKRVIC